MKHDVFGLYYHGLSQIQSYTGPPDRVLGVSAGSFPFPGYVELPLADVNIPHIHKFASSTGWNLTPS